MKNILILHISEFGGHKRASQNIKEVLELIGNKVTVVNINGFGYIYPWAEKIVDSLYTITIKRFPKVWGLMYDKKPVVKVLNPLKRALNVLGFRRFSKIMHKVNPDIIVATQAFPCGLAADFKGYYKYTFPLVAVVTDYHPHQFWIHPQIDAYIVADKGAKDTLVALGVAKEKVKAFGIPISLKFLENKDKGEVAREHGLQENPVTILVMGGGSGFGRIKDIVLELNTLDLDFQLIVVCGKNKRLYKWFKRKRRKFSKPIYYFGYIDFVNDLMDFSDIIITKAGGITVSEALSKELAMIIIDPIPGQEERNVRVLKENGAILEAKNVEDVASLVERLVFNKRELAMLKKKSKSISAKDSSLKIAHFILQSID